MSATTINTRTTTYAKKALREQIKGTALGLLVKNGSINFPNEAIGAKRGKNFVFSKFDIARGKGVGATVSLEDNLVAIDNTDQTMVIDELAYGIETPSDLKIEYHETVVDLDEGNAMQIAKWFAACEDTGAMYQLAGAYPTTITRDEESYTGSSRTHVTGHNTIIVPTSSRIVRAAAAANDQSLTSSDTMTLDLLDSAITGMMETYPTPQGKMIFICSSYQERDLIHDGAGKIQLAEMAYSALAGGSKDSFLFDKVDFGKPNYFGTYRGVDLYSHSRVARGVNSSTSALITTVQRAVLVSANALSYGSAFGKITDGDPTLRYINMKIDGGRWIGEGAVSISGCVKNTAANGQDQGVYVVSTYGA